MKEKKMKKKEKKKKNRTRMYVKVYVSEKGTLIYLQFAKSRRNFLRTRSGTSRRATIGHCFPGGTVETSGDRISMSVRARRGRGRGRGGEGISERKQGLNRVKSSLKLIIKIKRLAKLVIYYFRRPIRGTSLGILRLNVKRKRRKRKKRSKKEVGEKKRIEENSLVRHARV